MGMEGGVQRIGGSLDPSFGATVAFLHCALRDHFQKNPPVGTCATTESAETLAKRHSCFWLIADFNSEDDVQDLMATWDPLVQCGHINYVRSQPAWESWHCTVAKNTAHIAASRVIRDSYSLEDIYLSTS